MNKWLLILVFLLTCLIVTIIIARRVKVEIISIRDFVNSTSLPEKFKASENKVVIIRYNDKLFNVKNLRLTENKIDEFVNEVLLPQLKISNKVSITLDGYSGYKGFVTGINSTEQGELGLLLWKDNSLIWITNSQSEEIEYIAKWFIERYG